MQVQIGVVELSTNAFALAYRVLQEAREAKYQRTIAEATTTLVSFDYVAGKPAPLSDEAIEKLAKFRPHTLADAMNIEGITPSAIKKLTLRI